MSDYELEKKIALGHLCYYDKRNPDYWRDPDFDDDPPIKPRNNCYCDNCFYGSDKLAMIVLKLIEDLEKGRMNHYV